MADLLHWAGHDWKIKVGIHDPRQNHFKAENIKPSASVLSMTVASEISLTRSLGYGKYRFVTDYRSDELCPNTVIGLFLYAANDREIDIELNHRRALYTIQVPYRSEHIPAPPDGVHKHTIVWTPRSVEYYCDGELAREYKTATFSPGKERVHINVWTKYPEKPVLKNPPIIIREFLYTPLPLPRTMTYFIQLSDHQSGPGESARYTLSVGGRFPLVLGCSIRDLDGRIVDIPHRVVKESPVTIEVRYPPSFIRPHPKGFVHPMSGRDMMYPRGEIMFALWRDARCTKRYVDTGWIPIGAGRSDRCTADIAEEDQIRPTLPVVRNTAKLVVTNRPMKPSVATQVSPVSTGSQLFDETRFLGHLQKIADNPNMVGQYLDTLRAKYTSRREIALIDQWAQQYSAGERLIKSKTEMMRAATEYRGLERQKQEKEAESEANSAKLLADKEEHLTRAAKAKAERQIEEATLQSRIESINNPPKLEFPKVPVQPTPQQLRKEVLGNVAKLEAERDKVLTITNPDLQQQVRISYDQLIQKELEKLK